LRGKVRKPEENLVIFILLDMLLGVIKSRRMQQDGHITHTGSARNGQRNVRKREDKRQFGVS
jgi:hypothetical protein